MTAPLAAALPGPFHSAAQKHLWGESMGAYSSEAAAARRRGEGNAPTMRSVYVLADPDYLGQTGVIARPKRVKGPMRAIPYDEVLERLLSRRAA